MKPATSTMTDFLGPPSHEAEKFWPNSSDIPPTGFPGKMVKLLNSPACKRSDITFQAVKRYLKPAFEGYICRVETIFCLGFYSH